MLDKTRYRLPEANYIKETTFKSKIMFMNSYNTGMNHHTGWLNRMDGQYKHTTAYTIDKDGSIYQHFNPDYCGKIFDRKVDDTIIGISMVNLGYLKLDTDIDSFITWLGDIYKGDKVVEKRWRGHKFWEPYTDEQKKSAIELAKYLCDRFTIGNNTVTHNTTLDTPNAFSGVMYRSNFDKYYSDLSPAWDFKLLKENMENGS